MGSLTSSLTLKLSDAMTSVNPRSTQSSYPEEEKSEQDAKLSGIEVELEEIA